MSTSNPASYVLVNSSDSHAESDDLDTVHTGLVGYFCGRLTLAPLEEMNPKSILELGAGSGAWAIDAAARFPQAHVLATDLFPMPPRGSIPSNLRFMQLDLSKSYPFEDESFDVIHGRFIIMHLANGPEALSRIVKLLKPGGWLLLEEPDDELLDHNGRNTGLAGASAFAQKFHNALRRRGADPVIGPKLAELLKRSYQFMEINVKLVTLPLSGHDFGSAANALAKVWKARYKHLGRTTPAKLAGEGMTEEDGREFIARLDDPNFNQTSMLNIVWAKKRIDYAHSPRLIRAKY
ncbi:S-adenosyl-L-methionine-dependent methyltransferase [Laetiporus sulphureus 93-53]|uniref:S-adenosyl-L-methionine-dependent methyltransferase n=1 Tax=Laetiporus sulphureus 93-53 TaxID=1314785 RepID=A0A165DC64_9APHY|nr:S-adenosyl-L-methionine-dependent methyltransferase [Laetiporus sulphureus 93-53]KZT04535.1 S-adenosyl-L-methionine-dependent methyltransferase [Laetiporus sulphureus 93-53]